MSDLDRMNAGDRLPPATPEPEDLTPNAPAIQRHYPFSQDFMQISSYEQETHLQSLWKKYVDVMHSLGSRVSAAPLYDHFASVRHNPSLIKEVGDATFNPFNFSPP